MDVVGGYQLEERVGSGSSGTVWRARSTDPLARLVALKRVGGGRREDDGSRLEREASILAELDHPHIVRVLGIVDDGAGTAIVMQYASGGSLERRLASEGRLPAARAVAVLAPVADALASSHRAGVLHGDVKPGNILFTSDGEALLSDFGVARWLSGPVTADHAPSGTAEYLAPEVLDGAAPDARSDVYALGVVAYEMLVGRPPFTGPTSLSVIRAADAGDHVPLGEAVAGVPEALAAVVEEAIARQPEHRPATAAELASRMRVAVGATAVPDPEPLGAVQPAVSTLPGRGSGGASRETQTFGPRPPAPLPPPEPSPWPRRTAAVGIVAASVAVLAVGFALLPRGSDDAGPARVPATTASTPTVALCPELEEPPTPPGGMAMAGDVDGDGCDEPVVWGEVEWNGERVVAVTLPTRRVRFAAGEVGDAVAVGDWTCDGVDTFGFYRPADGSVHEFRDWPALGSESSDTRDEVRAVRRDTGIVNGVLSVVDVAGGCQELVVEPAS